MKTILHFRMNNGAYINQYIHIIGSPLNCFLTITIEMEQLYMLYGISFEKKNEIRFMERYTYTNCN